jgi:hypothetical protein
MSNELMKCKVCGSAVVDSFRHRQWHDKLDKLVKEITKTV